MSQAAAEHDQLIRRAFTQQAEAYAANPTIADPEWALRLAQVARPTATQRVLEVATGPGYVAMTFARFARQVVGLDLTAAPLAIAEAKRHERSLANVSFSRGDATRLPFGLASFDIVVCRLAFHHFLDPAIVLAEMVRVCRPGGSVVVEDLTASEHPDRASYYNAWERLRDPSHRVALSLGQLVRLFAAAGLEVIRARTEARAQVVEQWLDNAHTPPAAAAQVRQLLERDLSQGLSGLHLYRDEAGALCFDHRMTTLVGQKR